MCQYHTKMSRTDHLANYYVHISDKKPTTDPLYLNNLLYYSNHSLRYLQWRYGYHLILCCKLRLGQTTVIHWRTFWKATARWYCVGVDWVGDSTEISVEYYGTLSCHCPSLHSWRYLFSGFWCFPSSTEQKDIVCWTVFSVKTAMMIRPWASRNGCLRHFRQTSLSPSSSSEPCVHWLGGMACVAFLSLSGHMTRAVSQKNASEDARLIHASNPWLSPSIITTPATTNNRTCYAPCYSWVL